MNTIHIGHNKHFTFLLKNKESTFIEGAIYANYTEQILITEKPTQFIISLEHKLSPEGPALNSFEFKFKNNGTEDDGKTRTQISFDRKKEFENVSKFLFNYSTEGDSLSISINFEIPSFISLTASYSVKPILLLFEMS